MLIGSTNSLTPCDSNTWSPEPCPFSSIIRPYWKPEQPPPWTNTRKPLLALFSSASSSLIFMAAVSETLIMKTLYQEPVGILHSRLHAVRPNSHGFPGKTDRIGRNAVAGHRRGAARPGARPGAPTAPAGTRHGRGRAARRRPAPAAVAAAEIPRREARARRPGVCRRADSAPRAGAHADAPAPVRRARRRRRGRSRRAHQAGDRGRQHGTRIADGRLAAARSGGAAHGRGAPRSLARSPLAGRRARGQPLRARAAAAAVWRRAGAGAAGRARRVAARLLSGVRLLAGGGRSGRRPPDAALLVLRRRMGADDLRVHLLPGERRPV